MKKPMYVPEGIYHVVNHANGRENIFQVHENYGYFLKKYVEKMDEVVKTIAYCLMPNHFHFLIKVREKEVLEEWLSKRTEKKKFIPEGLSNAQLFHFAVHRPFHDLLGGYAKAYNKFHDRSGSLLRQNTERKIVADIGYVKNAIRYVHNNAVYHGFVVIPEEWPYSSYNVFLGDAPTNLPRKEMMQLFGGKEAFVQFHHDRLFDKLDDDFEK